MKVNCPVCKKQSSYNYDDRFDGWYVTPDDCTKLWEAIGKMRSPENLYDWFIENTKDAVKCRHCGVILTFVKKNNKCDVDESKMLHEEYLQIIVGLGGKLRDFYCEVCGKFSLTELRKRPSPEAHLPGKLCSDCLYIEATK
jgi:hypothetical protein